MIQNMKLMFNQKKYFLLKNLMKESRQLLRELKKGHMTKDCDQTLTVEWLLTESRQEIRTPPLQL